MLKSDSDCFIFSVFPVSPPTADGSHDFLLFLMLCQNFVGDLFRKALAMASVNAIVLAIVHQ